MNAIEVNNLTKQFKIKEKEKGLKGSIKSMFNPKYKTVEAVNDISFNVEKGEILAFIGPNGAGKSTTIKMLTGILYPTNGNINILGINPSKNRKQLAYKIGTVFGQKEQLWTHLTPYDNFKFFGAIYDLKDSVIEKRIEEVDFSCLKARADWHMSGKGNKYECIKSAAAVSSHPYFTDYLTEKKTWFIRFACKFKYTGYKIYPIWNLFLTLCKDR